MAEGCSHNCNSCGKTCESRIPQFTLRPGSSVKKVIGIVSGKGGVGKSLVTSLLASRVHKDGYKTAILDADITGPSIPESFGLSSARAMGAEDSESLNPVVSSTGIELMSMNFLLENANDPVIWRGPVIGGAVKQFWTDVNWNEVDFMFVDMPPGTGDVPLTVFQSLPVDGIIIVSTPQSLVKVIVEKAVKMAKMMNVPILGLVENMSYVKCPDCNKELYVFGKSNIEETAKTFDLEVLGRIPMAETTSMAVDRGEVELLDIPEIQEACKKIESLLN